MLVLKLHRLQLKLQHQLPITFEEYDETQKCEITMTYLYRATKSSYKTNIIKFEVDVSDKPQAQTRQLVTTQINKGKMPAKILKFQQKEVYQLISR